MIQIWIGEMMLILFLQFVIHLFIFNVRFSDCKWLRFNESKYLKSQEGHILTFLLFF